MKVSPRYDGPAILEFDGPVDDQLVPVTRQRLRFAAMLAELGDDDWRAPSRCENWTVQDVVTHLVGVNAYWQLSIEAGLAGNPTRMLDGFDPAATPEVLIAGLRTLSPTEVLDQLVASHDGLLGVIGALDDAGWSTPAETPAGHVPIRLLVQHALWDCWVHERDIALPLGLTPPIEADEVASSIRYAAAVSPGFLLSSGNQINGRFAVDATEPDTSFWLEIDESVHVHDGAPPADTPCLRGDAVELTEALSIRAPLPDATPTEWHELLRGLAAAFT
jgi:uncharacterized protein (TIGR03083 family)